MKREYIFLIYMTGLMVMVMFLATLGYSYEIEKLNSKTEIPQYVNIIKEE